MRATWYVLEDGTPADPNECAPNDAGQLVHKSGALVAMRGAIPSSTGVDVDEGGKLLFGGKGDHDGNGTPGGSAPAKTEDMKPEPKPAPAQQQGYKTRGKGR